MARTSNIFARVEPGVKEQAEEVLEKLGIPMSNAIDVFLRQVIYQQGIPFEMKLPASLPLNINTLSEEQFNKEINAGIADLEAGRVISAEDVRKEMSRKYTL
jgi:DNA-damage-inducible protein J